MPLDDSWLRDTGPTFVVDGRGGVAGVDWRFNSWGERFLPYDKDAMVAERLLGQLDVERYAAPLVLEGGSIHVDGAGRSEEHTSELQSLMRNSYAVFCLKKKKKNAASKNPKNTNKHNHNSSTQVY